MVKRYSKSVVAGFMIGDDRGGWVEYLDYAALQAENERLKADAERLNWLEGYVRKAYVYGASFDFAKPCEGESGGFRFMTRHRLGNRQSTLRGAIDAHKGE